jgi:hypothetical protein
MLPAGSAVPAAVQEVLPKWLLDRPALTESLWAYGVSLQYALTTVGAVLFGAAAQDGRLTSPLDFFGYCATHWWGTIISLIVPLVRARTAFTKATPPA